MISRRKILFALGAGSLAGPLASFAQPPARIFRIGLLASDPLAPTRIEILRADLASVGYVEGKNLRLEVRSAEGKYDRLAGLADELVALKVDLIITYGSLGPPAAKRATSSIPIVFAVAGDVVGTGLVPNLARPGGNMTGAIFFVYEIMAKRVELLKEISPQITQVGVLLLRDGPGNSDALRTMAITAKARKVELRAFEVAGRDEFESAFAAMAKQKIKAVVITEGPLFFTPANAKAIATFAVQKRMLTAGYSEFVDLGGTIGYGPNFLEMWHRSVYFVDRILRGTRPGDIPIEQATKFDLTINAEAAKAIGLKIPQAVLLRADRVIE